MATIEIVRFEVPAERAEPLVAGHEGARRAIDAVAPGWNWSRLGRFDECRWIEVVAWRDRAAFERAFEFAMNDPAVARWFDLADPGWTIELGEPIEDAGDRPPQAGTMEVVTAPGGEESALVATAEDDPAWSSLIALDGRVWRGDSWVRSAPGMARISVPAPEAPSARPSWAEVAVIAHSCDAASGASV